MAKGATVVSFTISHEGAKLKPAKSFTLQSGSDEAVRIGRAPGNDIVIDHRGSSQYHCELRLLPDDNGGGNHRLHVRDLSMNGTGMRKAEGKQPECLAKHNNEPVPDGAVLLVPMMLKAPSTPADRAWLKVDFQDSPAGDAEKRPPAGRRKEAAAADSDEPAPPGAAANDGSASEQEEKDAEKNRMKFVDLLLKTREVSAGTTYDEARRLLSNNDAWHAVDEATRRECFEIFVEHLGNHHKKSKKKEKSGKAKKEKRRRRDDEDQTGRELAEASSKGRRRRDGDRKGGSDSPDRGGHRKGGGSKRDKKGRDGRDKSRGRSAGGGYSRSLSRPKKRRRGRSDSA